MTRTHNNAHTYHIDMTYEIDDARIVARVFDFIAQNVRDINDASHVDDVHDTYTFEIVRPDRMTFATYHAPVIVRVTSYIDAASFDTLFYIDDDDNVAMSYDCDDINA